MAQNRSEAQSTAGDRPENPYYTLHDTENVVNRKSTMYKILIDSDEGRAYEKLATDAERLNYMRTHAHDSFVCVEADSAFLEDARSGKEYVIDMDSPAYQGLQKFLQEDGSSPPPGTKEFEQMVQYYKDNATEILDLSDDEGRDCCDRK